MIRFEFKHKQILSFENAKTPQESACASKLPTSKLLSTH